PLLARFGQAAQCGRFVLDDHAQHGAQVALRKVMPGAAKAVEVGEDLLRPRDVAGRALDLDAVRLQSHSDVQAVFQDLQVLVASSEELLNVGNDLDVFLHSACAVSSGIERAPVRNRSHIQGTQELSVDEKAG